MLEVQPAAIEKISEILNENSNEGEYLRVFVQGGGCSGLQYGFTIEKQKETDDHELIFGPIKILVDSMSSQYLMGAQINYENSINGEQFVIKNPNATTSCGCGNSFAV